MNTKAALVLAGVVIGSALLAWVMPKFLDWTTRLPPWQRRFLMSFLTILGLALGMTGIVAIAANS